MLHEGRLLGVPSETTLDTLPLLSDPTATVRLPTGIPTLLPRLDGTDALVLRGTLARDGRIEPLFPSPARTLGPAEAPVPMAPWSYVGVRFDASGSAVPATVTPTPASVHEAELAGHLVRTIAADALPAGAYALTYGAARAVLFAAGSAPSVADAD
jgi:hypothetical protein